MELSNYVGAVDRKGGLQDSLPVRKVDLPIHMGKFDSYEVKAMVL